MDPKFYHKTYLLVASVRSIVGKSMQMSSTLQSVKLQKHWCYSWTNSVEGLGTKPDIAFTYAHLLLTINILTGNL